MVVVVFGCSLSCIVCCCAFVIFMVCYLYGLLLVAVLLLVSIVTIVVCCNLSQLVVSVFFWVDLLLVCGRFSGPIRNVSYNFEPTRTSQIRDVSGKDKAELTHGKVYRHQRALLHRWRLSSSLGVSGRKGVD